MKRNVIQMYAVNRMSKNGEWEKVTTIESFAAATNFARAILPAIFIDLYVDNEDEEYYKEEFDKQALTDDLYIEGIINVEKIA